MFDFFFLCRLTQAQLSSVRRPKMVAWFVSHCDTYSEREKYVGQLRKHIEVSS